MERLVERITEGQWGPGHLLPTEAEIAAELGVSSGTVRKALEAMSAEHIISRRQGRGTFVSRLDPERVLFQFFHFYPDNEERNYPKSIIRNVKLGSANSEAASKLQIQRNDPVVIIERIRILSGQPCIFDIIVVSHKFFPDLEKHRYFSDNLYVYFAENFNVVISNASEQLKAINPPKKISKELHLNANEPVLAIQRISRVLNGDIVEWRTTYCRTGDFHYRVELT